MQTIENILALNKALQLEISANNKKISNNETKIKTLNTELQSLKDNQRKLNYRNDDIYNAFVILTPIDSEFLELKNEEFRIKNLLKTDTITIAQQKELIQTLKKLKLDIKNKCKHKFIAHHDAYQEYDYDHTQHPFSRNCLLCGTVEEHYRGEFSVLVKTDYNIINKFSHTNDSIGESYSIDEVMDILRRNLKSAFKLIES